MKKGNKEAEQIRDRRRRDETVAGKRKRRKLTGWKERNGKGR